MAAANVVRFEVALAHVDVCTRAGHEAFQKGHAGFFGKNTAQWYDILKGK